MGYRSDVAIAMRTEDWNKLVKRAKEVFQDNEDLIDYIIKAETCADAFESNEIVTKVMINDVRWYEGNPDYRDVEFIEDFINELEDEGKAYVFIKIGEDIEDNTERWSIGSGSNEDMEVCGSIELYRKIYF